MCRDFGVTVQYGAPAAVAVITCKLLSSAAQSPLTPCNRRMQRCHNRGTTTRCRRWATIRFGAAPCFLRPFFAMRPGTPPGRTGCPVPDPGCSHHQTAASAHELLCLRVGDSGRDRKTVRYTFRQVFRRCLPCRDDDERRLSRTVGAAPAANFCTDARSPRSNMVALVRYC